MSHIYFSWSILSAWQQGRRDDVRAMLAGVPTPMTLPMKRGVYLHKRIADKKMCLLPFMNPDSVRFELREKDKRRNYFVADVTQSYGMTLQVDVMDQNYIIDWKTGKKGKKSYEYDEMQIYVYAYLLRFLGHKITKGYIAKVDSNYTGSGYPNNNTKIWVEDYTCYKINDRTQNKAQEFIETVASEIYSTYYI